MEIFATSAIKIFNLKASQIREIFFITENAAEEESLVFRTAFYSKFEPKKFIVSSAAFPV